MKVDAVRGQPTMMTGREIRVSVTSGWLRQ